MVWPGWGEHGEGHRVRRPLAASHRRRILAIHGVFIKTFRKRMQVATRYGWKSGPLPSGGSKQTHRRRGSKWHWTRQAAVTTRTVWGGVRTSYIDRGTAAAAAIINAVRDGRTWRFREVGVSTGKRWAWEGRWRASPRQLSDCAASQPVHWDHESPQWR